MILSWQGRDGRHYEALPSAQDTRALARLYGSPVLASPQDLDRYAHLVGFDQWWGVPQEHVVNKQVAEIN